MGIFGRSRTHRERAGSYAALLLMLVAWLFVFPLFHTGGTRSTWVGELAFAGLLLAAVNAAAERPREMRFLAVFALVVLGLSALWHADLLVGSGTRVVWLVARILFLLLVGRVILRHVLRAERVSPDLILGAVCAYLLLAAVFAVAYRLANELDPGAIREAAAAEGAGSRARGDLYVYFSVVTLTTLGYGDVVPVSPAARALAQVEAVAGQLYVALVLAWLVGLYMGERRARRHGDAVAPAPEDGDGGPQ